MKHKPHSESEVFMAVLMPFEMSFEVHKHLDRQDWEMFVETPTTEQFLEKREHFKNLHGRITDNHRLGPEGYPGKEKGKWRKEDAAIEEAGSENPWDSFLDA
ncbi:uncharacterized protein C2845_PM13G07280 [Panicum miliaceum]|uniref:Uncharacterized protein n=1 Tax=Panicum miliaceum TaxID=4540 RepID=A0A3L6RGS3_PANMI|nr:uncharacterized protein C2845_PM13G07280 [Panicum miliaceum]